jgi:hypothetical protein
MHSLTITSIVFASMLAGCAMDGKGMQSVEVENTGHVCVFGYEPAGSLRTTFVADQPIEVTVTSFACLSSECTTDHAASCEARVDDTSITITTRASWTTRTTGICSDDCTGPSAACETPPVPAGTYSLVIGEHVSSLVVPSMTDAVPCFGDQL